MIEDIIEYINVNDLKAKSRYRHVLYKRYYLYNLLRNNGLSLSRIGRMFNQTHATVLHGIANHNVWYKAKDPIYLLHTRELREMFVARQYYTPLRTKILECDDIKTLEKIKNQIKNNYY
jgi:hypothetical protein